MTKYETMNSEVSRAQHGWVVFTKWMTASVIIIAVVLGLMAVFLL